MAELATLIPFIEAILGATPAAIAAFQALKAMHAAGIEPTPEQWKTVLAGIDAANAGVQAA